MKRIFAVLMSALIAVTVLSLCACSKKDTEGYPVTLANVTITQKPESIVCLSDSVADIMIACGYADRISARSEECTQPELSDIPSVGTKSKPLINKLMDYRPDVVFADKSLSDDIYNRLKENNVPVLIMMPAKDSESLTKLYENVCSVADGKTKGAGIGSEKAVSILMTMSDLQRMTPEKDIVTTACYLYDMSGNAAGNNTMEGKLISYANAVNVCGNEGSPDDMNEKIILSNPDYIFCAVGLKARITSENNFKNLKAVKNNHVYEIDSLMMQRQGNSMTEVLSYLIELMYPELKGKNSISNETSDNSKPESSNPESSKSESSKPESSNPESSKPESSKPESSKPESSKPESSKPESSKPESSKPESSNPESSKPESSKPETSKPETSKPETSKPETSKPETSKPETSKPETSKPETSKPEISEAPVPADYSFTVYDGIGYGIGENYSDIVLIQDRLAYLGYFNAVSTGYYGALTSEAMRQFEENNGLYPDGYASDSDLRVLFSAGINRAKQQ